jgi:superoxide dismutase
VNEPDRLPDLADDRGALEPHISGTIVELHHGRHQAGHLKDASRAIVQQVYDHQGNRGHAAIPLLDIDAGDHAYYLQHLDSAGVFFLFFFLSSPSTPSGRWSTPPMSPIGSPPPGASARDPEETSHGRRRF